MPDSLSRLASLTASHRIFVRRLVAGLVLLNLLVMVLTLIVLARSKRQYEERVEIQTSNLAQSLSQTIAGCIAKSQVALFAVKAETQRQIAQGGIDAPRLNAYLAAQHRNIPELHGLRVIDAQGQVRYGDDLDPGHPIDLSDRQHFQIARDNPRGGLIVTLPLYSRVTRTWVIDLVLPLENPDGSFAGSALAAISLDYFKNLFAALKIGNNGVLTLRDRELAVIVRYPEPAGSNSLGSKVVSRQLRELVAQGKQQGSYRNPGSIDSVERTFSFRTVPPYPLLVTAGLASRDYLQPWYREVLQMALFLALFVAASGFSGWLSYRNRLREELSQKVLMRYRDHLEEAVRERTAALQDSEEQFRTLCNFAPIGIFRSDTQGNALYLNPYWARISGWSVAEGLGLGWQSCIHPDDRELLHAAWAEAAASGEIYSLEHRQITREARTIWVHAMASAIKDLEGHTIGFVGTVEDITERVLSRQELLKTQKLESLGIFAGGIAHDFNNILTAMLGNISLASLQLDRPELAQQRLQDAEKAATRARDLTKQLLTFAKGGEPVKEVVALPELLREAAQFALHGSRARCSFEIAEDLACVEADAGQLSQVVHNLVLNASQAMPNGGTIVIKAENREADGARSVVLSVTDTGVGIPRAFLSQVFDPYFTTKRQGSGLGLATCYSIVKKHGGQLQVVSTQGMGSTFTVVLPAAELARRPAPAVAARQLRGSGDVLVLDDEEEVREVARAILEEFGYRVDCAASGSEALQCFERQMARGGRYVAVILDLTVPGGPGGKEVVGELRRLDPQLRAIVSSGYSNDPILANHRDFGFNAVLSKPYQIENVAAALAECQDHPDPA